MCGLQPWPTVRHAALCGLNSYYFGPGDRPGAFKLHNISHTSIHHTPASIAVPEIGQIGHSDLRR